MTNTTPAETQAPRPLWVWLAFPLNLVGLLGAAAIGTWRPDLGVPALTVSGVALVVAVAAILVWEYHHPEK